jgi:transcriptional regulator with XRE-family HTH domain
METPHTVSIRNKIIGALVKRARLKAGESQRACAEFLGCSVFAFSQYERGQKGLSLPQLEALAYLFDVPAASLWDEAHEQPADLKDELLPIAQMMALRRRILAVEFRQCRRAAGLTQREMGQLLGCSANMISQYERSRRDIPLADLEVVSEECGHALADFLDDETIPLSRAAEERLALARVKELSPEVRDFVLKPSNALYLRIAMTLSALKTDSLRQIAETLLEITY